MLIALTSSAAAVSSSPNTQLIKSRLVMQPALASAISATTAWPYSLAVGGSPLQGIPYFDNSATDPTLVGP